MRAPDRSPHLRASRAADPDSVAGADHRARHRPLRLCAGAAGHARRAALVLFGRRLHEHHQCGRLSRRRAGRLAADPALRPVRERALGHGRLRVLARALRDDRQFCRVELCAAARGFRRGGRLCRRRRAGRDDRAIAAGAGEFSAEPVLCRTRHRHPRLRTDRAFHAAGVRPGLVVDRVVGADAALGGHDHAAAARAARRQCRDRHATRDSASRSGRC